MLYKSGEKGILTKDPGGLSLDLSFKGCLARRYPAGLVAFVWLTKALKKGRPTPITAEVVITRSKQ
jgi:hypothetical protein